MSDSFDVRDFLKGFLAEAEEHLAASSRHLTALDDAARRKGSDPKALRELFRSLHTLKGLAGMIGTEPIAEIAHEMESALRLADQSGGGLAAPAVDALGEGLREIQARVTALANDAPVATAPRSLLQRLADVQADRARAPTGALELDSEIASKLSASETEQLLLAVKGGSRALRIDFTPSPEHSQAGLTITSVRERVGALGDLVKVVPRWVAASPQAPGGLVFTLLLATKASDTAVAEAAATGASNIVELKLAAPAADARGTSRGEAAPAPAGGGQPNADVEEAAGPTGGAYVRVEVARLDEALDHLSALVVTRFRLERAVAALAKAGSSGARELATIVADAGRQIRDLRAAIMRARMVAVNDLLSRAPLLVRGLAQERHKKVHLEMRAGSAELDKAVGDRVLPSIIHLLRNAVDHAIEPPEERRARGKPEEGRVRIECREQADNTLELRVIDDGRGIDVARLAARAGVPAPQDDEALLELLAKPGLSTLEQATHTSGRGMGMNIVKDSMEKLGGDLRVRTAPGQGSTFQLRVPLSVTIVDAFSLECGDERFVVPVNAVEELTEVEVEGLARGPVPAQAAARPRPADDVPLSLMRYRGEVIPLLELSRLLRLGTRARAGGGAAVRRPKAVIVRRAAGDAWAFQVDRMIGRQEVVVRPLADPLVSAPGLSGCTDLGDGVPTLVLDLPGLARQLSGAQRERMA